MADSRRLFIENESIHWDVDAVEVLTAVSGFLILFAGHKFTGATMYLAGAVGFGVLSWNIVEPLLGQGMPIASVFAGVVGVIGGLVGGLVTMLLQQLALGLTLGVLIATFILLADGGHLIAPTLDVAAWSVPALYVGCCFLSLLLGCSQSARQTMKVLAFSMFGALLVTIAVDLFLESNFIVSVDSIIQMHLPLDPNPKNCNAGMSNCFLEYELWGWAIATTVGFMTQACSSGLVKQMQAYFTGYRGLASGSKDQNPTGYQRTFEYPVNQAFNYFDPSDLPQQVADFAETVFSAAEELGNFFGFQDDNVRNQAEHLLILLANHRRYTNWSTLSDPEDIKSIHSMNGPQVTPIHSLHPKIFQNYSQWCSYLGVPAKFMPAPAGPQNETTQSRVMAMDVMLYLLIWGESANIRHMPEVICFLYHKMMQEYVVHRGPSATSLYPGFFLDHVVTPIYEVVEKSIKGRGDHPKKRNYDDFNEFFWQPECLSYQYRDVDLQSIEVATGPDGNLQAPKATYHVIPVAQALADCPKTFLEKRSVIAFILAFSRFWDFLVLTFHFLATLAFGVFLVWETPYLLQVVSSVFLTMNFLGLCWVMLEAWHSTPGLRLTLPTVSGLLLRLVVRYVILVYQIIYYMWSMDKRNAPLDAAPGPTANDLKSNGDYMFWWWQYIWLSCVVVAFYLLESSWQLFPGLVTCCCRLQNDAVQAFLNIMFPQSRNYVAKTMHDTQGRTCTYLFFWVTLFLWKFAFSYYFEVYACIVPSIMYFDDYMNYPDVGLYSTMALIVCKWTPMFLVYLIDGSIWFSIWVAAAGIWVGFVDKLGEINNIKAIREKFMQTPEAFCSKFITQGVASRNQSQVQLMVDSRNNLAINFASSTDLKAGGPKDGTASLSTDRSGASSANSSYPSTPKEDYSREPRRVFRAQVAEYLDVHTQKWGIFGTAWNEIINQLRETDVISDQERNLLKFHSFEGFSKPVYLPVFQTAGMVEKGLAIVTEQAELYRSEEASGDKEAMLTALRDIYERIKEDVTQEDSVSEAWELGSWFLTELLGPEHAADLIQAARTLEYWMTNDNILAHLKLEKVNNILQDAIGLVEAMKGGMTKRKKVAVSGGGSPHPARPISRTDSGTAESRPGGMSRQLSTNSLAMLGRSGEGNTNVEAGVTSSAQGDADKGYRALKPRALKTDELRDKCRDQIRERLRSMFGNLKNMVILDQNDDRGRDFVDRLSAVTGKQEGFLCNDLYASSRMDRLAEDAKFMAILRKLYGLLAVTPNEAEPHSPEAQRRLSFFVNSLFMDVPKAPPVADMLSWTVMTPFYSEDVILTRADLERRNEDGLTVMMYLQTLYASDWKNFLERLGIKDEQRVFSKKYIHETRLWASLRSQTLFRTVEGMMYQQQALRLLGNLENVKSTQLDTLIKQKFGYVVTCQVYGRMKRNQDPKADDIDFILNRWPNLRVAYIDEVRNTRDATTEFYSVLIKKAAGNVEEIYRIKLPGNPVLGEGKPENQNHAVVFTRGENLMAIDMNQDNYFEEALKMRNLLQEFHKSTRDVPITILGFREHIFTGSVSSLANYMALQELSFVTLGQRVLNNPLRQRLHYGHPDIFDKLFFMTRGGISKASKGINLSEDIFAGFNNQLRGGNVEFKEYVQVGKGRDVGMQQIYKFEAKLAQGNAEQSLSRDVHRLAARVDFGRLLSLYFGGLGFYINSFLTVFTVFFVVYLMTYLALFGLEAIGDRKVIPEGVVQMCLGGMGILQTVPMFSTLAVEKGVASAVGTVLQVFFSGGPLYFMFHIQTKSYYFIQTLLAGNAKYRPTGRGFVTRHSSFDENFRFFASSHFYLGFELLVALIILGVTTKAHQFWGRTWSLWLADVSLLASPFWFNPGALEWTRVLDDYSNWMKWMSSSGGSAQKSWEVWWKEEMGYFKQVAPTQRLYILPKSLIWMGIAYGIVTPKFFTGGLKDVVNVAEGSSFFVAVILIYILVNKSASRMHSSLRRCLKIVLVLGFIVGVAVLLAKHPTYAKFLVAVYYLLAGICHTLCLFEIIAPTKFLFKVHDIFMGHVMFIGLFILAALQLPAKVQTWLLFHNALSQGVVVDDILKYARRSKEEGVEEMDLTEMRKVIQHQEHVIQTFMQSQQTAATLSKGGLKYSESTNTLSLLPTKAERAQPSGGKDPVWHASPLVFQQPDQFPSK